MSKNIQKIVYINLDHRTDRKEQIENEMQKMDINNFERFPAIYCKPPKGTVGASKSFLSVLKNAAEKNYKNVLILQDDVQFIKDKEYFENTLENLFTKSPNFDVCLLGCGNESAIISEGNDLHRCVFAQQATAVLVNGHYINTLIDLYEASIPLLEKTMKHWVYALDMVWNNKMKTDNWICAIPKLVKQRSSFSDCRNAIVDYS